MLMLTSAIVQMLVYAVCTSAPAQILFFSDDVALLSINLTNLLKTVEIDHCYESQ